MLLACLAQAHAMHNLSSGTEMLFCVIYFNWTKTHYCFKTFLMFLFLDDEDDFCVINFIPTKTHIASRPSWCFFSSKMMMTFVSSISIQQKTHIASRPSWCFFSSKMMINFKMRSSGGRMLKSPQPSFQDSFSCRMQQSYGIGEEDDPLQVKTQLQIQIQIQNTKYKIQNTKFKIQTLFLKMPTLQLFSLFWVFSIHKRKT